MQQRTHRLIAHQHCCPGVASSSSILRMSAQTARCSPGGPARCARGCGDDGIVVDVEDDSVGSDHRGGLAGVGDRGVEGRGVAASQVCGVVVVTAVQVVVDAGHRRGDYPIVGEAGLHAAPTAIRCKELALRASSEGRALCGFLMAGPPCRRSLAGGPKPHVPVVCRACGTTSRACR